MYDIFSIESFFNYPIYGLGIRLGHLSSLAKVPHLRISIVSDKHFGCAFIGNSLNKAHQNTFEFVDGGKNVRQKERPSIVRGSTPEAQEGTK
jgi:hypothetical protein